MLNTFGECLLYEKTQDEKQIPCTTLLHFSFLKQIHIYTLYALIKTCLYSMKLSKYSRWKFLQKPRLFKICVASR